MRTKTPREQLGARTLEIVEVVKASEAGMSSKDIADRLGITQNTVTQHLSLAKACGLLVVTRACGICPIWYTTAHTEVVKLMEKRAAEKARIRYLKHQRAYKRRKARERAIEQELAADLERDSMPIRRSWVDAANAEPLRPKGPVSVFDLGAL